MLYKQNKSRFIIMLIILLLANGYNIRLVKADSLENVKDTISTSQINQAADHVIKFTTSMDIGDDGYFEVTLPAPFGDIASGTCSGPDVDTSTTTETIRCTYSNSPGAATSTIIILNDIVNPGLTGAQKIEIATYNSVGVEQESGQAVVYLTAGMPVHAQVLEELSFSLVDSDDLVSVNGITLTGSSTLTTLPFGTLDPNASSTLGQTLSVETNAANGFTLTVEQNQELKNENNNTINSFNNSQDGTGSSTPHAWVRPRGDINKPHTYGHLGVTTDDATLSEKDFTGGKYVGLNGGEPLEIMYHDTQTDGETQNAGLAHVAYTIEISDFQESGDYQNVLTYIVTPTF